MAETYDESDLPEKIGPYRLERRLAVGGMGAVYLAHHELLSRPVALKRVLPEAGEDEDMRLRLRHEARTAAQLSHPNVAQIYDLIEFEGDDWIVMEYVEGETLAERTASGPLDSRQVVDLGIQIARGLSAAHARGIVHRDLKGENLMLTPSGRLKILDFGIALDHFVEVDEQIERRTLGTPESMSPEQVLGYPVDHLSDLFSFGTLLYGALTGVSPFRGEQRSETLKRVCTHRHRPMQEIDEQIPDALCELVDRLLEKEKIRRPRNIESVLTALQNLDQQENKGPTKILFVDDEADFEELIRQRYRRKIRAKDVELTFARSGREALEKLHENPEIALVFSDINMPEMDGLELLAEIRILEREIVVVMITAYDDMKNIRRSMNLGAFDFLVKPLDFEDLEITRLRASQEASRIQERRLLREEILLLEERHRFIREAVSRRPGQGAARGLDDGRSMETLARGDVGARRRAPATASSATTVVDHDPRPTITE